jgi:hypothetical protein
MRLVAAVACAVALVCLEAVPGHAEKRVALVIGNDRYDALPALQKAVNDARAVAERFARLGYEVIRVEDASRRAMNEKIGELAGRIGRGDTAAFFFAGHGVEINNANFLLPTDTPRGGEGQEDLIARESVSAPSIIETLRARGARVTLMILDACRDNPFKTANNRGVGGSRGLGRMQPEDGVFVLYSAGVGQTALDRLNDKDADPNSVFTRALIRLMERPGLSVQELAKSTQSEVRKLAATVSHFQMPAYYDQIDGTITLAGVAAAKRPASGPDSGQPFTAAIIAKHSGKCLDSPFKGAGEGTGQYVCNGDVGQKWEFIPDGNGYFTIKWQQVGTCLEIIDGSTQRGTLAWQHSCESRDSLKFKLIPDDQGFYSIAVKNSGQCLAIAMAAQTDGAALVQWHCQETDYFKWKLHM